MFHKSSNLGSSKKKAAKETKQKRFSLSNARKRLYGSRFRKLNEELYNSTSKDSFSKYSSCPDLFSIYHEGYREQVSKWPYNPLNSIIHWLEGVDKSMIIGDFGCGEAIIAKTYPDRKVYSFDLVAENALVTACNIAKVPIPNDSLDVAIFCLSLMGRDWPTFIIEGTRCLRRGGVLSIVEVKNRLRDPLGFTRFIESLGYKHIKDPQQNESDFFISTKFKLQQKLAANTISLEAISDLLSPCLYKRR